MPGRDRISSDQAMLFLGHLRQRLTIVALTETEYFQAIEDNAALGIVGGTIYDALLARCAIKVRAETLYTWNLRHYKLLGPDIEKLLKTP